MNSESPIESIDLLSQVFHDLKNPLTAILLNTAYMIRNLEREPSLTEKEILMRTQLKHMEEAGKKMNQLLTQYEQQAFKLSSRLEETNSLHSL
jgi:signal transduction histidine kinase